MKINKNITIETDRIKLVPLAMHFLQDYYNLYSDYDTCRYLYYFSRKADTNFPLEKAKTSLEKSVFQWETEKPEYLDFAILDKKSNNFIGIVDFSFTEENNKKGIGWTIDKKYRKCGYATEAANAIIQYLFSETNTNKIIAYCDTRNIASQKIMQKLGMKIAIQNQPRIYFLTGEKASEMMMYIEKK